MSCPGPLDLVNARIITPPNLRGDWHHLAVAEKLQSMIHIPVYLNNDGNLAALAEAVAGEGTITFTINEPSLLAFVVDKTTLTTTAVSPKTSVSYSTVIALFGIAAVVAVCGLKKKSVLR